MRNATETFKIELTMENGQITTVKSLAEDLKVSKPLPSLDQFPKEDKEEIIRSMQHGTMMLMGQNSPGWIIILTALGYTRVWRD